VGDILASVPRTGEAKDAVLLAQVPTTIVVDPTAPAAQANVTYSGDPQFKPIEGTSLSYASNTPDKVIKLGDVYHLCLQGVWFLSSTPQGPCQTAPSVPQLIYTIRVETSKPATLLAIWEPSCWALSLERRC
jgi:hypothetical protein